MVLNIFGWLSGNSTIFGVSTRRRVSGATVEVIKKEWKSISVLLKGGLPSQLKEAMISADKSLDTALKDITEGESMGERLKNAKDLLDKDMYQKTWGAHRMRNMIVHEAGYEPPYHMILKSINDIKKTLISLGVKL